MNQYRRLALIQQRMKYTEKNGGVRLNEGKYPHKSTDDKGMYS